MSQFEDIMSLSTELSVEETAQDTHEEVDDTPQGEPLETLETLSEKAEDRVPLKKYMEEKRARKELEEQAQTLAQELERIRNSGANTREVNYDLSRLSEKHNVDEDVLRDIVEASYAINKDRLKAELENDINPKLAEFESMKQEKQKQNFENTFNGLLKESLSEMPEYSDIIDKDDLKTWITSGKYSKLTLPQLIEQKYGKFVGSKKSIDGGYTPGREAVVPNPENMTDKDWTNIENDPALKDKWKGSLEDRLRKFM